MNSPIALKYVSYINRLTLSEDTDPEFGFHYIDISSVGTNGILNIPDEVVTFAGSPSRARRIAPSGSVLVSTVRTYLRAIARAPEVNRIPFVYSTGFAVLEAKSGIDRRFLYYACRSEEFIEDVVARSVGVSYPAINPSDLSSILVPAPSFSDQHRIADFLDDQVARIDNIVAAREEQIGLLEQTFLSKIADVLAGVGMESGGRNDISDWLPPIPCEWGFAPVSAFFAVQLGKMLNAERASGPHLRPYLRNANVHWFEISTDDLAEMSFEPGERLRYSLRAGDLMVCEGGAGVAEAAIWRGDPRECYYQKSLHRVRPIQHVGAEWLMYWLRLAKASGVFESEGNLATIPHLTGEQLKEARIPIPPLGYQGIARLDRAREETARARQGLASGTELLEELKRSLITAAVTGVFDVTTADGSQVRI